MCVQHEETAITLVLISALLTGFGQYERIAKHAGAGTLVPITGFANAVGTFFDSIPNGKWLYGGYCYTGTLQTYEIEN